MAGDMEVFKQRLDAHDELHREHDKRLGTLETNDAVRHERHKSVLQRLGKIDQHQQTMNNRMWAVILLMITLIAGVFFRFMVAGGFNVVN